MPQPLRDLELPPGLNPITAGRFGVWLWGKRNQARAKTRRGTVTREYGVTPLGRLASLVVPWSVYQYPGLRRWLGEMLQVSPRTAARWLHAGTPLPRKHAVRLERLCAERIEQLTQLREEFARLATEERPSRRRLKRESRGG